VSGITARRDAEADSLDRGRDPLAQLRDVLLLGSSAPPLELLRARLARLGYRTIPAKTPEQAQMLLRISRGAIGAVVIPPDLPVVDLRRTVRFLSDVSPGGDLWFLAAGPTPPPDERARLRSAGVSYSLFEPLHDHVLRFQINRALAGSGVVRGDRRSVRAPTNWEAPVWVEGRRKTAHVYSVSASGAYLATPTPSPRGARIELELPNLGPRGRLTSRVVTTNVPGNLASSRLPVGMGVAFVNPPLDTEAVLHMFAQQRLDSLAV